MKEVEHLKEEVPEKIRNRSKLKWERIEKILRFLKKNKEPVWLWELARTLNIPYASLVNYIKYLEEKQLVKTKVLGNIKLVYFWKNSDEVVEE